ncbi:MAG: hypothetical protein JWO68_1687 [Actinomycetia bacterium]|nr:hypothetical protein [Actinomycetes bacterium]
MIADSRAVTSLTGRFRWQASAVAHHDLVDVSVSVGDGTRQYVGRCRCGWETPPCGTAVHALALVEDHGARSRLRSRRRPDRSDATARPGSERTG